MIWSSGKDYRFRFRWVKFDKPFCCPLVDFDRSEFSWLAASTGLSIMIYRLMSSAKSLIEELMSSTISLMYKRKSKGPRIEP